MSDVNLAFLLAGIALTALLLTALLIALLWGDK